MGWFCAHHGEQKRMDGCSTCDELERKPTVINMTAEENGAFQARLRRDRPVDALRAVIEALHDSDTLETAQRILEAAAAFYGIDLLGSKI